MSTIKVNRILTSSGGEGVDADIVGNVTGNVTAPDSITVGTAVTISAGVITATSFSGDGSALSGIDATALKDSDGNVIAQAEASGLVITGIATVTSGKLMVGDSYVATNSIGIGTTTTAGRNAGVGTATGSLVYDIDIGTVNVYYGNTIGWKPVGVEGGMIKTADPTIPTEIVDEATVSVTNPTVIGGEGTVTFTYQWMVELSGTYTNIPNGTSQSVTLPTQVNSANVLGNKVRCTVTATDSSGFTLVLQSNETTVIEFKPNLNAEAGLAVVWNVNTGSGTTPSSIGWATLQGSEKALCIVTNRLSNGQWYILSDAGKVYTISYNPSGASAGGLETANMYTWSGETIKSIAFSDSTKITQVNADGEMRYTNDSGSNWDNYNTSTSGFSKVLWISQGGLNVPLSIHEDGEVKHATSSGAGGVTAWESNTSITSYSLGDTFCSPPTGKKIVYFAVSTPGPGGRHGAVVLCNDKRLYAIGNTGISGWPENGTRTAPVLVTGVTQTFNQITNFGNSALPGLQAIDTNGKIWFFDGRTDNNPFSQRFTSTTFKSLFGQQFPYTDNCCSYNLQDMMAIGESNNIHTIIGGASSTSLQNTWDFSAVSNFPTWDSSKARHGGAFDYNNNYNGDWSAIILPQ